MSWNEQRTVNFDGSSFGFCVCVVSLAVLAGQAAGFYVGDGMSKKDEALKLALEALKQIDEAMPFPVAKLAQKALREALANEALERMADNARELGLDYEPAQQTIQCKHRRENNGICPHHNLHCGWPKCNEPEQPAQQEPVAWQVMVEDEAMKEFSTKDIAHDWCVQQKLSGSSYTYWIRPLYTRPLAREWVGLTDEERAACWNEQDDYPQFARAIEAKLKEKNNG